MVSNEIEVVEIPFEEAASLRAAARREHVIIADQPGTRWYGVYRLGDLVGAGAVTQRRRTVEVRGTFIRPECRGKGYGGAILRRLVIEAQNLQGPVVSNVMLEGPLPDFFQRLGFSIGKITYPKHSPPLLHVRLG